MVDVNTVYMYCYYHKYLFFFIAHVMALLSPLVSTHRSGPREGLII